jgi:uncharacterized membrane protein YheB (UPF0754 family)
VDHKLMMDLITIPLFTGIIGYVTNWTGVLMLFQPLKFHGFRLPGNELIYPYLHRRIQILPIYSPDGRKIGWQGMVPSRAEKMASIAVDKSISKLGSVSDFYRELDPDSIAEHFVAVARPEIRGVVDRIVERESPRLWRGLPAFAREAVYRKVESELPENASKITATLGEHIEDLVDPKWMAIRHLTENPKLLNSIFREMGAKELRFMQNFGFYFGYPMGFLLVGLLHMFPYWWLLPAGGVVIGYVVNWVGINMIYEPLHPKWWVPWRQGLMLKRRTEIIEGFADIIADDVITTENMARELLAGSRADRTLQMLDSVMRESVDRAVGRARLAVVMSLGSNEYSRIQSALAPVALDFATDAMADRTFAEKQAGRIRTFIAQQMEKLSLEDFVDLLRSATKQDEWLLFVHGAVLGSIGGFIHLAIFGV